MTSGRPDRLSERLAAFLVGFVALLVYLPAVRNAFVNWDDDLYIYKNPFVQKLDATFWREAFLGFHAANWHPVTWISHGLDYAFWGLNPVGHHLTNFLLHAVNSGLVVLLVMRLGRFTNWSIGARGGNAPAPGGRSLLVTAVVTGLLFGLHPLHVESVAWISERKDLLCGLFFLLALYAYAAYAASMAGEFAPGSRPLRNRRFLGSLAFFAIASMSKPMAISLPAVLLVLDWCPFGRVRSWKAIGAATAEKLPFFLLAVPSAALTILAQRSRQALVPLEEIAFSERAIVAIQSLGIYLWKMLVPIQLSPYYPYPDQIEFLSVQTLLPATVAVGVTITAVVAVRHGKRLWLAAWAWYVLTLAPVLGIVQVGRQAMADRYTYLPCLGPFLVGSVALAWGWERIIRLRKGCLLAKGASTAALAAMLLALSVSTLRQTTIWDGGVRLWSAAIERTTVPQASYYYNRAIAYHEGGRVYDAIADYDRAIALDSNDARSWLNRGLMNIQVRRFDLATIDFGVACRLGNDFACKMAASRRQ